MSRPLRPERGITLYYFHKSFCFYILPAVCLLDVRNAPLPKLRGIDVLGNMSKNIKAAFVTYLDGPEITSSDDLFAAALEEKGVSVVGAPWDDPNIDWKQFDIVVLRSPWNYHLHISEFLDWVKRLESYGVKLFNAPEVVRWNCHKRYLIELQEKGIEIPKTKIISKNSSPLPQLDEVIMEVTGSLQKAVVVKPCVSASANETYVVREEEVHAFQPKFHNMIGRMDVIVQEFLSEIQSDGEWGLFYFDKIFSHAMNRIPAGGDFRAQSSYGAEVTGADPTPELRRFCDDVLSKVSSDLLYARVDVVRLTDGRVALMELEVIDPSLYFHGDSSGKSPGKAANSVLRRISVPL